MNLNTRVQRFNVYVNRRWSWHKTPCTVGFLFHQHNKKPFRVDLILFFFICLSEKKKSVEMSISHWFALQRQEWKKKRVVYMWSNQSSSTWFSFVLHRNKSCSSFFEKRNFYNEWNFIVLRDILFVLSCKLSCLTPSDSSKILMLNHRPRWIMM